MKIASIVFIILSVLGIIFSNYMYGEIKLIIMTGALTSLMCGIGFILSYVNFVRLYNTKDCSNSCIKGRNPGPKAI
jgi:hypothetical protein